MSLRSLSSMLRSLSSVKSLLASSRRSSASRCASRASCSWLIRDLTRPCSCCAPIGLLVLCDCPEERSDASLEPLFVPSA
eukprot:scaffold13460_cov116-Isochrysis_galbana.AAC.1